MRFLIAAAILVTAQAASLGSDKCTWGPTYWCSSVPASTKCSAFKHCLDTQWTHQLLDVDQSDLCTFSQKVVQTARELLEHEDGKDQATNLLATTCSYVTDKQERRQCKQLVTKYLSEVLQLVQSEAEPQSVAVVLGLCKKIDDAPVDADDEMDNEIPVAYAPPTNDTICDDCWAFVGDLRNLMSQQGSKDQFMKVMEDICSDFGILDDLCKAFVDQQLPSVFDFLKDNDNPELVCRTGTFCSKKVEEKVKWDSLFQKTADKWQRSLEKFEMEVAESEEIIPCGVCRKTLVPVFNFEKHSYFRDTVEKAFAQICSWTSLGERKCHALAETLPKELAAILARHLDADTVCQETLRCSEDKENQVVVPEEAVYAPVPVEYCGDCEKWFSDVKAILRNKDAPAEATALAKQNICQGVGPLEFQCNAILEAAMPTIMEFLAQEDNPARICAALTLCPKRDDLPKIDLVKAFEAAWEKRGPLGDFKCDECTALVQDARELDRNPDVQKGIETFFNEICDQLGQQAQQCKNLLKQYSPQLFELIASELDPTVICEVLLRCTKPSASFMEDIPAATVHPPETVVLAVEPTEPTPRFVKKSKKNSAIYQESQGSTEVKVGESVECAICKLAMEALDNRIGANRTEESLMQELEGLCNLLPSTLKNPCTQFIQEYTPAIIDFLLQELDPLLVCDELQLCENGTETHYSDTAPGSAQQKTTKAPEVIDGWQVVAPGAPIECQICQFVVGTVDSIIGENRTEAAVQKALDDVCYLLPSGIRDQCLSFVNEYAPVVVELILQELDPDQVCFKLGMCNNVAIAHVPEKKEDQPRDGLCDICKEVIDVIDNYIGSNRTEPAIKHALEQVCTLFPDTIRSECETFVRTYAPAVINLLLQEIKPEDICKELGLCPKKEDLSVEYEVEEKSQPLCDICKLVLQQIDIILGNNRTEPAVEEALDRVCGFFPETIQAECQSFVNTYAPAVINLIIQEIRPTEICKKLGLCQQKTSAKTDLPHTVYEQPEDDLECELCHAIITEINKLIGEDRSEKAIIKAVEVVCDFLSGDLKLQCKSEVENYGPAVIDLLQHMDDPKAVCRALKACPSSVKRPQVSGPGETEECIICRTLATYASEALKDEATVEEVTKLLEDVCSVLPVGLNATCKMLVDQLTPMIMQLLAEKDDPLQVCQALKLCATENDSFQSHLLGVDACTFGPAYWCASMDHAQECKVVEHCIKHYGLKP